MDDPGRTILVVEDDAGTRDGLVAFLESEGFSGLAAANGRDALALLEAAPAPPRLILLDLMMPVMDGWQFLAERRLRPSARFGSPVVLLSGLAFIHGASDVADFIRKPVDLSVLRACVWRFCGGAARASSGRRLGPGLEIPPPDQPRFFGTFAPAFRASERPIAIACSRLVTFFPERPDLSSPRLRSCRARSTFAWALGP